MTNLYSTTQGYSIYANLDLFHGPAEPEADASTVMAESGVFCMGNNCIWSQTHFVHLSILILQEKTIMTNYFYTTDSQ